MRTWWVNQNQTYRHEVGGGYLWSPKANKDGRRNRFYDSMTEAALGDIVFSFSDTQIKAVGVVTGACMSAPKPPEFGSAGSNWSDEGWYLPVRFTELRQPLRPKDHMDLLGPTLPDKYSPLQENGNGLQGVYLAPVPEDMAAVICHLLDGQVEEIARATRPEANALQDVQQVLSDSAVQITAKQQLVNARIGQGLFRSRVELIEPCCRVTGVTDRRFLRASHIKPWMASDNRERLDGHNGLLLSPHVDHLFDKGFISFTNDGALIASSLLPKSVLSAWKVSSDISARPLLPGQRDYMEYHRGQVFLAPARTI
ncbi:MAG: hypothetical protein RI884_2170 [Pseudomonadota bacterium]|jgi:hypothetical protein